jgi:hypothetical protein
MEEIIIVKLEAEIGDLKNQLNAAQGELKRFGVGVEQSVGAITLNSLNSQLVQLQKQLSTVDVGSAAFKNIGAEITAVESKVNSALTSISNNANRSKTGFNGLNNSINQLSRELPAFAINANIGFLAISNNLPILFDEIKRVTAANKELADSGKPTTSVFKQLSGALFSWQTALSLGVTLLTIYGGKIVEMVTKMTEGKEVITSSKLELDALNETYKDKSIKGAISDIVLLKSSLDTASKSVQGKKQFVEQYNRTIGTVTGTVNTFKQAEDGLVAGTGAYINAMIARATATKLADKAGEISMQIEDKKVEQAKQNAIDQIDLQKEYSDKYKNLLYKGSLELQTAFGNEANYVKAMIAGKKAITHKGQQEELAALKKQFDDLTKLTEKYYGKSGQITPFQPTKPGKTKTERPLDMALAPVLGFKLLANDALKLDQNLKGVKTTLQGFENLKPIQLLEEYQIQNLESIVNLLGNALTSAFDAALISGENFFKVLGQALLNLFKKLLAAAAAAAILSLLLAPLGFGAKVTGFVPLFRQLGGIDLSGGKKPKDSMVAMPTNTLGQGGYQIDIMGDKMRLLLDNNAIKNSRVV